MVSLKLKEECEQVFIGASLVNPSTGKNTTVDAKIDIGAVVSLFPMSYEQTDTERFIRFVLTVA